MTTDGLSAFLAEWEQDPHAVKPLFTDIYNRLRSLGAELAYKARPGVSYSLRAKHPGQRRELFVLADVIDDNPKERWLSVCFYADLVDDREGRGDVVPGGLLGENACCFDIDGDSAEAGSYVLSLVQTAFDRAGQEK